MESLSTVNVLLLKESVFGELTLVPGGCDALPAALQGSQVGGYLPIGCSGPERVEWAELAACPLLQQG